MGQETELKLGFQPNDASRLEALATRQFGGAPAKRERLVSVYYDTPKFKLRRMGVSLRVRWAGGKRIQTIKALNGGDAALAREEWEQEIAGEAPDIAAVKTAAPMRRIRKKVARKLRPVFETDVQRNVLQAHLGDSQVELGIDQGAIRTEGRSEAVRELEIELKAGDAQALFDLAARLGREVPLRYGLPAKAERGYALAEAQPNRPRRGEAISLREEGGAGEAFQTIGLSCLRQLVGNEAAVAARDGEGVHQARVALRRLRAALSLFRKLSHDADRSKITAQLKWLTEQLGPARDLDVLLHQISAQDQGLATSRKRQMKALETILQKQRSEGFERAAAATRSDRYRQIVFDTALWLAGGEWRKDRDALQRARRDQPIPDFASRVLGGRVKKLVKKLKRLDEIDPRQRHKTRIAAKKLRYAAEFFASLYPAEQEARQTFVEALKDVQSALGDLNDMAVHARLLDRLVRSPGGPRSSDRDVAFAAGLTLGKEEADFDELMQDAAKAGRRLAELGSFWS